jgi:hypothetical protein
VWLHGPQCIQCRCLTPRSKRSCSANFGSRRSASKRGSMTSKLRTRCLSSKWMNGWISCVSVSQTPPPSSWPTVNTKTYLLPTPTTRGSSPRIVAAAVSLMLCIRRCKPSSSMPMCNQSDTGKTQISDEHCVGSLFVRICCLPHLPSQPVPAYLSFLLLVQPSISESCRCRVL